MAETVQSEMRFRKLRILLVDDNQINLSVLSTLLKRRFGQMLEGSPIAVDSGLKAIQLLRTNVFDLILMDIQMPFLSGLECAIRIRKGEDGVLDVNRSAHIVAVTTAVGDEPEAAYRRAGMDGMIGKPVRFKDMQHYISPLSREAFNCVDAVQMVSVHGEDTMPPLPPLSPTSPHRLFYLPSDATIRAPQPDICQGADFEKMLRAQTKASLRKNGAIAVARSGTWSSTQGRRAVQDQEQDRICEEDCNALPDQSVCRSPVRMARQPSVPQVDEQSAPITAAVQRPSLRHARADSLAINKHTLSQQILREMEGMMDAQASDMSDSGGGERREHAQTSAPISVSRPRAIHRISSPPCLITEPAAEESQIESPIAMDPHDRPATTQPRAVSPDRLQPGRPNWWANLKARERAMGPSHRANHSTGRSSRLPSTDYSDIDDRPRPTSLLAYRSPSLGRRRDSQQSNDSNVSDVSTDVTTPAGDFPGWLSTSLSSRSVHRHESFSSGTTVTTRSVEEGSKEYLPVVHVSSPAVQDILSKSPLRPSDGVRGSTASLPLLLDATAVGDSLDPVRSLTLSLQTNFDLVTN